jgi:hypothetical protein
MGRDLDGRTIRRRSGRVAAGGVPSSRPVVRLRLLPEDGPAALATRVVPSPWEADDGTA